MLLSNTHTFPASDGRAVHFRLGDSPIDHRIGGLDHPPLVADQILCWKTTGVEPVRDPKDNVVWNTTYEKYVTCQECLELRHA